MWGTEVFLFKWASDRKKRSPKPRPVAQKTFLFGVNFPRSLSQTQGAVYPSCLASAVRGTNSPPGPDQTRPVVHRVVAGPPVSSLDLEIKKPRRVLLLLHLLPAVWRNVTKSKETCLQSRSVWGLRVPLRSCVAYVCVRAREPKPAADTDVSPD